MENEEFKLKVEEFFSETPKELMDVSNKAELYYELGQALYTMSELYIWPDDVNVSIEQALLCYKVVSKLIKNGIFPVRTRNVAR